MKIDIETERYGYTGTLSSSLVAFAKRQLVNATLYKGDQRRREQRHPMMLPVLTVGVDQANAPISEPFEVITRDVAPASIGLLHAEHMPFERIAIHFELAKTNVDLVIELKWREPMGPFYGSGGVYSARLDSFPVDMACLSLPPTGFAG